MHLSLEIVVLVITSFSLILQGMALAPLPCCRFPSIQSRLLSKALDDHDFSVRDSWVVLTVGDLHMEDDMSSHEQAREDCIVALKELSIMAAPLGLSCHSTGSLENVRLRDLAERLWQSRASELTVAQLEILLSYKREGDKCHSYLVSLGDLGRKE